MHWVCGTVGCPLGGFVPLVCHPAREGRSRVMLEFSFAIVLHP